MEDNPFAESNEFIKNSFLEVMKVLDEHIQDEELKKATFEEMSKNFNRNLGGLNR